MPGAKTTVPHVRRPFHERAEPLHLTIRANRRVGSLRRWKVVKIVNERMRLVAQEPRFAGRRRTFRVIHFSVQPDHLHLIVEAGSTRSLSRGVQGLLTPLARCVNRRLGRTGKLFIERYHARSLATPLEVRRAIVYVLGNAAKHPEPFPDLQTVVEDGIDPCSSARWFRGWQRPPPPEREAAPVVDATVWLLTTGWRRHGLMRRSEGPARAES